MAYNNNQDSQNSNPSNQNNSGGGYYDQPVSKLTNPGLSMAIAAMLLGFGSLFSLLTFFLPLALGGFAILLALLSKGYGKKMVMQAKTGLLCGVAGISITVSMFVGSALYILTNPAALVQFGRQYDETIESVYGQDTEDIIGFSFEDMMKDYADTLSGK